MKALPVVIGVLAIATAVPAWVPQSRAAAGAAALAGQEDRRLVGHPQPLQLPR